MRRTAIYMTDAAVVICAVYLAIVYGYTDYTNKHHRDIIRNMARELVMDSKRKINQTYDVRKEHSRFIAYEIGYIIGQIREKYKLMMEIYRITHNRYYKPSKVLKYTPRIEHFRAIHYLRRQENILLLAWEIDKLVEVLENSKLDVKPFRSLYEPPRPSFRAREDSDSEEDQKLLEEAVKSRYREEYLMRRLNSTGQSTTKKRFLDKWPVPGTWSLEMY